MNDGEIPDLVAWAHSQGHAISLIETMPLGEVDERREDRAARALEVNGVAMPTIGYITKGIAVHQTVRKRDACRVNAVGIGVR